ncbi:SLC25A19 [Cordylochernes scorpioides]|uniref:SLC25A19 n=1 Tax=Cordylochernes scorpioides TaxID=51811 RepID=A0ABY6LEU4_9ARAC|nr:SLC25A19 [Cordylochernes scorpioides]
MGSSKDPVSHFLCGSVAGCVATVASQPFDVVRTRLVGQGEPKTYNGMAHAMKQMAVKEGYRSFFKGLTPTLIQIAPQTGFQFGFYRLFSQMYELAIPSGLPTEKTGEFFLPSTWTYLGYKVTRSHLYTLCVVNFYSGLAGLTKSSLCGAAAGMVSKTLIYPLDLAKKRLQIVGFEDARRSFGTVRSYRGLWQCLKQVVRDEGLKGTFKGFQPTLIKAAVASGLHFALYEESCAILARLKTSRSS